LTEAHRETQPASELADDDLETPDAI